MNKCNVNLLWFEWKTDPSACAVIGKQSTYVTDYFAKNSTPGHILLLIYSVFKSGVNCFYHEAVFKYQATMLLPYHSNF